jgi:hypothetical protein
MNFIIINEKIGLIISDFLAHSIIKITNPRLPDIIKPRR